MTVMRLSMVVMAFVLIAGCGGEDFVEPTPTATPTLRATPTVTATPAPAPTLGPGANISFMGLLRADETLLPPAGYDAIGRPVYVRQSGFGFDLVIEAKRGTNGAAVGRSAFSYDPTDPTLRPDVQVEVSRNLGNGSVAVCDNMAGNFGGIPGFDPPDFDATQEISDALNDFGCRFNDGTGTAGPRDLNSACVLFSDGTFGFVDFESQLQFCATIISPMQFPEGDTIVTARVRDVSGLVGPERQIVIQVTGF
jgi:hypothetical protein